MSSSARKWKSHRPDRPTRPTHSPFDPHDAVEAVRMRIGQDSASTQPTSRRDEREIGRLYRYM